MDFLSGDSAGPNAKQLQITTVNPPLSTLAFTRYSPIGTKPRHRVILLHGFTQSSASFKAIALRLANHHGLEAITIDLPGHGGSTSLNCTMEEAVRLMLPFGLESIWVGYSLGARHLLTLCTAHPKVHWKAVFSGVNPGIEDPAERESRYRSDLALAARLKDLRNDKKRFETFLEGWTSQPLFQPRSHLSVDIPSRLINKPEALAISLELTSIGTQENLWPKLTELSGRFKFVTGGNDTKYLAIAEKVKSILGLNSKVKTDFHVLPNRGHAGIFDEVTLFCELVAGLAH